ncbi:MAG: 30S ribosomal protein S8 [Anaerolineae bacterium SM23_ 63]|nr:MAG: 30S ribosomal protein S8 [Anaerolineae bacterium SM23_ 63]HEY45842.1 30S ribosomal protein S8 [Anaerolineae bacterium]
MTVSDPIADMLTRIRNALMAGNQTVSVPSSKIKVEIARIMEQEGFIAGFEERQVEGKSHRVLRIQLKYVGERRERRPVINELRRVSRPGRRVYVGKKKIPWVRSGIGLAILSTPKGVMSGVRARQIGVGGEILCEVW